MVRSAALFAFVTAAFADDEVGLLQTKLSQVDKNEQTYNPPPVDYGPEAVVVTTPPPPVIKTCIVSGDPHIKTFDRDKTDRHFYDFGDYYIVKSSKIWIQGRYYSAGNNRFALTREFAMSEPGGGNKIICEPKQFEDKEPAGGTFGGLVRTKMAHSIPGWGHGSKELFDFKDLNVVVEVFRFGGHINVFIRAPQEAGMSGHCGNFNDDPNDDNLSTEMVPKGEVLFEAKEWTFTHPAVHNCDHTRKARGMAHCSHCAKHLDLRRNLEVDMEDCIVDYCNAGKGASCDVMASDIEAAKLAAQYR